MQGYAPARDGADETFPVTVEAQQLNVDVGALRSVHALIKDRHDRKPLGEIKLMRKDAAEVDRLADEIKAKYTQIFGV